jgi:hypothetical protein
VRASRSRRIGVALALGAIALSACGAEKVRPMTVIGTEMAFQGPSHAAPGKYDVRFRNAGATYHEHAFKNPAGEVVVRRSIAGGQEIELPVHLTTGTWELACYEPGHYEAGMHQPLVVESP